MIIDGIQIKGITCDSRKVRPGYGYVAIKGDVYDIDCAVDNGASIVFIEHSLNSRNKWEIPVRLVKDGRKLFVDLWNKIYDNPLEKMKIIAITGTNGKTTTAKMIYHILKDHGLKIGFINSEEIMVGDRIVSRSKVSMDTEELFSWFYEMIHKNIEIIVMEIDENLHKNMYGIVFDMAVHTNIDTEHMGDCEEEQSYVKIQKEGINRLSENGIAIINTDDKNSINLLEGIKDRIIITYGFSSKATVTASSIDMAPFVSFNCCIQRGITPRAGMEIEPMEFHVFLPLLGRHNVYNGLGAISAVLMYGVSPKEIQKVLGEFKGIKRRMYLVHDDKSKIIDDMSHNPQSYEVVFEAIQSMDYENLYMVNALIGNGGVALNKSNAAVISSWFEALKTPRIITTSSVEEVEDGYRVLEDEKRAFHRVLEENSIDYLHEERLDHALKVAISKAGENDLILLLGEHGMDQGEKTIKELL